MKKAVIYGFGAIGKAAYEQLKDMYDILFFVDKNAKPGQTYDGGVAVYEPIELKKYKDIKIFVATVKDYYVEIIKNICRLGHENSEIEIYNQDTLDTLPEKVVSDLNKRTIDLGNFLFTSGKQFSCRDLTFIAGGSGVLDYAFLKMVAQVARVKEYLEVGTYIGESINILTDCCEKLYSVTADKDDTYSMKNFCRRYNIPDYSERLAQNEKIVHYYGDSKKFDFSKHASTVDLYFIDGDHSYMGVYNDTKNIFQHKRKDAIVIWHDFKMADNKYRVGIVKAVSDALGDEFKNVYVTNNNICGIYIPENRFDEFGFQMREMKYEENAPLYTYDVNFDMHVV